MIFFGFSAVRGVSSDLALSKEGSMVVVETGLEISALFLSIGVGVWLVVSATRFFCGGFGNCL